MSDRIRVLSVCTSDSFGGAAIAAHRIHLAVRDFEVDSRMFVKIKGSEEDDVFALQGFLPHNPFYKAFDWVRNKLKNKWQHLLWRKYPNRKAFYMSDLRSTDIGDALKKIDYDILHLHWINFRFIPLNKLPKDKPIVWTLHDSWPFCGVCHYFLDCNLYVSGCGCCPHLKSNAQNDLSRRIIRKKESAYKDLDLHIVAPSKWIGQCAKESYLFRNRAITVIPNCVDTDVFRPLPVSALHPRVLSMKEAIGEKSIIMFGAVNAATDQIKGIGKLMEALQIICKNYQADRLALVIFGANSPIEGMPSGIQANYVGYLKDRHEFVSFCNIASVMVVPSYTEVFGQVASEAMSCGTPVTAFRCTGIKEVVDEDCGYLAKPFEATDLAQGILWCLENNKDGHLSRNARKKVLENYTPEAIGKQYAELYSSLMKQ